MIILCFGTAIGNSHFLIYQNSPTVSAQIGRLSPKSPPQLVHVHLPLWNLRKRSLNLTMAPLKTSFEPYPPSPDMENSPKTYDTNTLPVLPAELILQVWSSTTVDRVCLSLCNHPLRALFQTYFPSSPLGDENFKFSICDRLERDLPEYFWCDICNIRHRYDGSESFGG